MTRVLIEKAEVLVRERHAGQVRPTRTQQPKVDHIAEVARLTTEAGGTEAMIAAAWLHDIVEDTPTTLEEVREQFGPEVADLVDALTDPPHFEPLPLVERKTLQARRLQSKPPVVYIIKLADQISNVISVYEDPPLDWDAAECRAYIEGAGKLAAICRGQSAMLDAQFAEVFGRGCAKYRG